MVFQWIGPGFYVKWEIVWTVNAISGYVLSAAHMSKPIALWYGMSHILAKLAVVDGDWAEEVDVGVYQNGNRFEVFKSIAMEDRVDV